MNIKEIDKQYIANTYKRADLEIVSGKNATCYDQNGKEYIDFGSGIGVNSLGYCDDEWSNAISSQAKTLQHTSNYYYTSPMAKLAKKLCEKTGYDKVFFANSGAEANECAIKVARKYSFDKYGKDRNIIISLKNSFHGRTITTLSATGQDVFHNYFFPFTEGFIYTAPNDIEEFKKLVSDKVCAFMFEPILGEGGVIDLEIDFIKEVEKICKDNDILLIADEVQTGISRTGKFLASEHLSMKPNLTTLAKGLGGGLPIGAVLLDSNVSNVLKYSDHGTTFGGNPIVCAGANVVIDKVSTESFLKSVNEKADYIKNHLKEINEIESISGKGLMIGIKLKAKNASDILKVCKENGLLVLTAKDKIRFLPPLTISYDEINKALDIFENALKGK